MLNLLINSLVGWLLIVILLVFLATIVVAYFSFAPWLPSRQKDLPRIFALAGLRKGELFYDLGCGDGKLVFYANQHYGARTIGLELIFPFYLICKIRQILAGNRQVIFKFKNLFHENLSQADVVYIFGTPRTVNGQLKEKLAKELKVGAKVISYAFAINDWQPLKVDKPTEKDVSIYLYQKPFAKAKSQKRLKS